ncbi:MAG: hypothetical protein WC028_14100 [Candidatus Obscuribacterales bacterium]|jgi:hypothetical protein
MNKKLLADFAVYADKNDPTGTGARIAGIFLTILRFEYQYKLARYDYVRILPTDGPPGELKISGLSPISKCIFFVEMGRFKDLTEPMSFDYWLDLLSNLLKTLAQQENSEIEPIEEARLRISADKNCTTVKMTKLVKQTRKYLIEPELKLKANYFGLLLYVRLTELTTGLVAYRFVAQAGYLDIIGMCDHFSITENQLVLHHKPQWSGLAHYRGRGFVAPLKIPLANFQFSNQTTI